ncbi:MAG: branched-chain amino acid transaminase [Gammaproteobacteria bacterium]
MSQNVKDNRTIWHNGKVVPWNEANVHVTTHALHYGSSVFEGIRAYRKGDGPVFFRLREHNQRLFDSAKVYRIKIPFTVDQIDRACHQIVAANGLTDGAYLRPIAFRGAVGFGVVAPKDSQVDVSIVAQEWGAYLGEEALSHGVDVCISSWQRLAPNTVPAAAKAGGNYLSSQLIGMEAKRLGFHEGIGLTVDGIVSEGAGENLFMVKNGVISTPPSSSSMLCGITRDTLITLAAERGYEVIERPMTRESLYLADELFFTGTAVEVTPIRSVDRIEIGSGSRGPVTKQLQEDFFGLFSGATEDKWGWLSPLDTSAANAAA